MKQEIKPATGRLGVLVVGVGGAVATTMITGTLASRNAYEAAMYAEVLKEKDLNGVKDELEAIKPMPAAFDHNFAKRLNGTYIKNAATRWDMVEQLRQDIRDFKAANASLFFGLPAQKSTFRCLTNISHSLLWKKQ